MPNYVVKDAKGRVLIPDEVFELSYAVHINLTDPTRTSVQIDIEDDSSFLEDMADANCIVEPYNPSHD